VSSKAPLANFDAKNLATFKWSDTSCHNLFPEGIARKSLDHCIADSMDTDYDTDDECEGLEIACSRTRIENALQPAGYVNPRKVQKDAFETVFNGNHVVIYTAMGSPL